MTSMGHDCCCWGRAIPLKGSSCLPGAAVAAEDGQLSIPVGMEIQAELGGAIWIGHQTKELCLGKCVQLFCVSLMEQCSSWPATDASVLFVTWVSSSTGAGAGVCVSQCYKIVSQTEGSGNVFLDPVSSLLHWWRPCILPDKNRTSFSMKVVETGFLWEGSQMGGSKGNETR